MDKQEITLNMITDSLAYIDTGYNAEETIKILTTMYSKKNINWSEQPIYFYVLKYELSDNLPCITQKKELNTRDKFLTVAMDELKK